MKRCPHVAVEEHDYRPEVSCKGVRCVECHAVMQANRLGSLFLSRCSKRSPIPLERLFWKEYVSRVVDPMSYESRMRGYENRRVVR